MPTVGDTRLIRRASGPGGLRYASSVGRGCGYAWLCTPDSMEGLVRNTACRAAGADWGIAPTPVHECPQRILLRDDESQLSVRAV